MRILVVGDVHADISFLRYAYAYAAQNNCERIMQLGDFGYFPNTDWGSLFLSQASELAKHFSIDTYFLCGNHSDHSQLDHLSPTPVEVAQGIFYMPRGHVTRWGDSKIMTLGGAYSIDRENRILNVSYWEEEVISSSEYAHITARNKCVDILFAHDCPSRVSIEQILGPGSRPVEAAEYNREAVDAIARECDAMLIIHGRYHKKYMAVVDATTVVGLADNRNKEEALMILEL